MAFEVGDFVRKIGDTDNCPFPMGAIGRVLKANRKYNWYSVEFSDVEARGHNCGGIAKIGHGWNFNADALEIAEKQNQSTNKKREW